MESRALSVSTGTNALSPLLEECEHLPSKRYVIFDQSGNSRRILFHPQLPQPVLFHKTLALGVAAFENAKAARATPLPLAMGALGWTEIDACNVNSGSDNVNSYEEEDSEELDALLFSDKDEEDEVSSTVTFADYEETWAASDEVDQFENERKRWICNTEEEDDGEESNSDKRRRCNAVEDGDLEEESDTHLPCK